MSEFSVNLPPRLPGTAPAPNILTAIIPDPPRQLAGLDPGTIIRGTVQGRDPDGMLVVVTDKGALRLSTSANLQPGSQVTMEVRATGDRMQVLVLSVDGQPAGSAGSHGSRTGVASPTAPSGSQAPPPLPAASAPPPRAPVAIVGSVLHGTIVQATPDTLAQLIRSLLPGPVSVQVPGALAPGLPLALGQTLPQGAPIPPAQVSGSPGQPAPATSSAPPQTSLPTALISSLQSEARAKIEALFFSRPTATATAAPAAPLQGTAPATGQALPLLLGDTQNLKLPIPLATGAEVRLRLVAIVAAAGGQAAAIPAAASGTQQVMSGRIIGYTPAGNAVLQSPVGAIILQGQLSLPVGTQLSVAVEPVLPQPAAVGPAGLPPLPQLLLSIARGWPSLADAIAVLRQGSSEADTLAALSRLPQAGPKLAAGLVAAMQAIRAGDVEALLGALAATRGTGAREDGVRKLRQEFAQISSLAQDRPGIDWRCCFIPVLDDGTVRQINLFYRRDRRKDARDNKDEKSGTRFIVEVDMSRMGPFQFDGLVREKQFDLMVRSRITLPPKCRQDIAALFQEALLLGDYRGGLVFQKVKEFPVAPLEEIEQSAMRVSA